MTRISYYAASPPLLCSKMKALKRIIVVVLAFGIFFQQASQCFILASYLANRDYVALVLCVNRNHPEKHCNGKCHLKKQLQQDENRQGGKQGISTGKEDYCWISGSLPEFDFTCATEQHNQPGEKTGARYQTRLDSPFHPPCILQNKSSVLFQVVTA